MFRHNLTLLFSLCIFALCATTPANASEELPADFYRTRIAELRKDRTTATGQAAAESHAADRAFLYTALVGTEDGRRYEEVQVLSGLPYTKPLLLIPEKDMPEVHRRLDQMLPKLIAKSIYLAPSQPKVQAFLAEGELHLIFTQHQLETFDAESLTRQLAASGLRPLLKEKISTFFSNLRRARVADNPSFTSRFLGGALFGFMLPILGLLSPRFRNFMARCGGPRKFTAYSTLAGATFFPFIGYLQHLRAIANDEAKLNEYVAGQVKGLEYSMLPLSHVAAADTDSLHSSLHYDENRTRKQQDVLERLAKHHKDQGLEEPAMLSRRRIALAKHLTNVLEQKEVLAPHEASTLKILQKFLLKPYIKSLGRATLFNPDVSTDEEFNYVY